MAQPGIGRAVWFGIIGFLAGAALVIVIRTLQNLDPIWDAGVGLVFAMFSSVFFFIWGIGGFNFKLSAHGESPEVQKIHAELAEEAKQPKHIISSIVWQIGGILLALMLLMFAAALVGGMSLTTTILPDASVMEVGYISVQIAGQTVQLSQVVVLIGFVLFILLSLAGVAGVIGWLVFRFDEDYQTAKLEASGAPALGSGAGVVALPPPGGLAIGQSAGETADSQRGFTIPLPKWLNYLIVFGALLYFVNFPAIVMFGLNNMLADIWGFLSALFLLSAVILFIEIIPAKARSIDAVVKYALVALVTHVVVGFAAGWVATSINMYIDPFFAAIIEIIGQVIALAAPALVFRSDKRMRVIASFTIVFVVLWAVFYYAAIGLVMPAEPARTVISIANALLFTVVLLRLPWLLGLIGQGAALLARLLRWLPKVLFQRG
ncbi:MAG: hypothetical protein IAE89_10775 [Anaerolineae bacterium]|nr:hypothetical protein [Anaerolineae bacterium]